MTKSQRIIAIAITGALLLSGYAFGRITDSPRTTLAEDSNAAAGQVSQNSSTQAAREDQAFYLSDFKTGYSDGYNSGIAADASGVANTDRAGYNDGFKQGYADGYQVKMNEQSAPLAASSRPATTANRFAPQQVVYQPSSAPRKKNSTLKTVLTIAAPAAIGAGVGAAVGGKKGAGAGALIGGGGGALYHLIKNRNN
jgi:hypothetical protein